MMVERRMKATSDELRPQLDAAADSDRRMWRSCDVHVNSSQLILGTRQSRRARVTRVKDSCLQSVPLNGRLLMSRIFCIGIAAALACACGPRDNGMPDKAAATDAAAQGGASGATGNSGATAASGSIYTIVLTGCLQRGSPNQAVGTSGKTPARPGAPAADTADFILVNATPGAPDASGQPTGTIGAGNESYVLEGADLAQHEHQMVRVSGRFPDALAGGVLSSRPAGAAPDTNAPAASAGGVTGSLAPNAKQRAQRGDSANDVAHMRHVQVDNVTMIAPNCIAK